MLHSVCYYTFGDCKCVIVPVSAQSLLIQETKIVYWGSDKVCICNTLLILFCFLCQGFQGKTGPPGPGGVVGPQVKEMCSWSSNLLRLLFFFWKKKKRWNKQQSRNSTAVQRDKPSWVCGECSKPHPSWSRCYFGMLFFFSLWKKQLMCFPVLILFKTVFYPQFLINHQPEIITQLRDTHISKNHKM